MRGVRVTVAALMLSRLGEPSLYISEMYDEIGTLVEQIESYENGPQTVRSRLKIRSWARNNMAVPLEQRPVVFETNAAIVRSGPLWHAEVRYEEFLRDRTIVSEWTEFWDGQIFYRVREERATLYVQIEQAPARGGALMHDATGMFDRLVHDSIIGVGSMVRLMEAADLVSYEVNEAEREWLLEFAATGTRVRVVADDQCGDLISLVQLHPHAPSDEVPGEFRRALHSFIFRVLEWSEHDGVRLPRVALREAITWPDKDDEQAQATVSTVKIERTQLESLSDQQLPAARFRPDFEDGVRVIDHRLRLIYTVGEHRVEVDDVTYNTREPMHPDLVDRLHEIVITPGDGQ